MSDKWDGQQPCPRCGKVTYSFLHSCPMARVDRLEGVDGGLRGTVNDARIARMLRLPAADQRVSHLHMRAVAALIEQWEEDDADSDDYTRGQAAEDLRRVIAAACTCRALPHDRRCPTRMNR